MTDLRHLLIIGPHRLLITGLHRLLVTDLHHLLITGPHRLLITGLHHLLITGPQAEVVRYLWVLRRPVLLKGLLKHAPEPKWSVLDP
jgi:hypothetical protein